MRHALLALLLLTACDDAPSDETGAEGRVDQGLAADAATDGAAPAPDAGPLDDLGVVDQGPAAADGGDDPDPLPPQPWPVTEPGHYGVGFRTETIEYAPPRGQAARRLRVVMWYPTQAAEGRQTRYRNILLAPGVFTDAPPALAAPAPTVVFSHGNGGFAEQNWFMGEYFASHGWLFVAFDHTGNTFDDSSLPIYRLYEIRPGDVSAVIDFVADLPPAHPLAGGVSGDFLVAGHSFGGYTSLAIAGAGYDVDTLIAVCGQLGQEVCDYLDEAGDAWRAGFRDPRVQGVIPLTPAGANLFQDRVAAIDVPVLMMTGGRDATLPNAREGDPLWAPMDGPAAVRLDFPEAGHFSFSNACDIAPQLGRDDGCGEDFIAPGRIKPLINAYAMAFARLHVLGDAGDADLLTGERVLDAEALTLSTKP